MLGREQVAQESIAGEHSALPWLVPNGCTTGMRLATHPRGWRIPTQMGGNLERGMGSVRREDVAEGRCQIGEAEGVVQVEEAFG